MSPKQPRSLSEMLRILEAVEANLLKAERLWKAISERIPQGIVFGADPKYDDLCRRFEEVVGQLPAIEGFRVTDMPMNLNAIAQGRFDAQEIDEIGTLVDLNEAIEKPGRSLDEYRFRFERKRRGLIRASALGLIERIDGLLAPFGKDTLDAGNPSAMPEPLLSELRDVVAQLETLLGSSVKLPTRWGDLLRHLHFGQMGDLYDIVVLDWPDVRPGLVSGLYGEDEPLPVPVDDLDALTEAPPQAPVPTKLAWDRLSPEDFERLLYALLQSEPVYENVSWLMRTTAADRGRDLSALRVATDPLSDTRRDRVIIQCKHWLGRSISPADISILKEQVRLWEPPRVDVLIIATSGRFTADAVQLIERQNQSDSALRIEMWPESHLEMLLARRPGLIADFGLR